MQHLLPKSYNPLDLLGGLPKSISWGCIFFGGRVYWEGQALPKLTEVLPEQ